MFEESRRLPTRSRYAAVAGYSRRSALGFVLGALAALVSCRSSTDDDLVNASGGADSQRVGSTTSAPVDTSSAPQTTGGTFQVQLDDGQSTVDGAASVPTSGTAVATTEQAQSSTVTSATLDTTLPPLALPPEADLIIEFTYTQAAGGRNQAPYVAVWIEDGAEALVATVALWYLQTGQGDSWLPNLRRWYRKSDSTTTNSGPTRAPGQYQVAWSGSSADGMPQPAGRYWVCVESARERGPYSLVRTAVDLAGSPVNLQLGSDAELEAVSVRTT